MRRSSRFLNITGLLFVLALLLMRAYVGGAQARLPGQVATATSTSGAATPATTAAASPASPVVFLWRTDGCDLRFAQPSGMALDSTGRLYVIDSGNQRIQVLNSQTGERIATWGDKDSDVKFAFKRGIGHPGAIAVDSRDTVHVADDTGYVQMFDSTGKLLGKWGGGKGTEDGQIDFPWNMKFDQEGNIYVASIDNSRVQKFDKDGKFLKNWAKKGFSDGEFDQPTALVIDPQGALYVGDYGTNLVQKFDKDGKYVLKWGGTGTGAGQFLGIQGMSIDSKGRIFVGDNRNNRVQIFNSNGEFLNKWGEAGVGDGKFNFIFDVIVDAKDNVYVSSNGSGNYVQKFRLRISEISGAETPSVSPCPPRSG